MRFHRSCTVFLAAALVCVVSQVGCAALPRLVETEDEARRDRSDAIRAEMIERQRGRNAALDAPDEDVDKTYQDHLRDGDRLREQGNISKAAIAYLRAQWAEGGGEAGARRLAFLALRKDPQKSLELFTALVHESPDDPVLLTGLAVARIERGDLENALPTLTRAEELTVDRDQKSQVRELLGILCDRMGRHDEARRHYQLALDERPRDVRLMNNAGVSHLLAKRYPDAAAVFEKALSVGASDPALHNNLGLAYGLANRYPEAMREFKRAGTTGDALNNMGYLLFLQGRHEKALEFYEKALLSNDTNERRVLENIALLERVRTAAR